MQKIIKQFEKTKNEKLLDLLFKQFTFEDIVNYLEEQKNNKDTKFILDYMKFLKEEQEKDQYQIYLNSNDVDDDIKKIIYLINYKEDKLVVITNYSYNREQFELIIEKFKKIFPNKINDLNEIIFLYNKYQKIEESVAYAKSIMIDILESNLCYEEYCSMMGYSFHDVKEAFAALWNTKNEKYRKTMMYIRKRSKEDFYKKINDIAKGIYLEKKFDIFTYYKYTKLTMRDLIFLISKVVKDDEIKENVKTKINSLYLKYCVNDYIIVNEKQVLSTKILINGREITAEEKLKILEYMRKNRMHRFYFIYIECLKKYAIGQLDLNNMQYTKTVKN